MGGWQPHQVFHRRKEIVESDLDNQFLPVSHTNVLNGERAWLLYDLCKHTPVDFGSHIISVMREMYYSTAAPLLPIRGLITRIVKHMKVTILRGKNILAPLL